jgi:hypothetical protein
MVGYCGHSRVLGDTHSFGNVSRVVDGKDGLVGGNAFERSWIHRRRNNLDLG